MSTARLVVRQIAHGSTSTYTNHKCRCDECHAAWAAYCRGAKERRRDALATSAVPHGKASTYGNWGCRCRPCTDDWSRDWAARYGRPAGAGA